MGIEKFGISPLYSPDEPQGGGPGDEPRERESWVKIEQDISNRALIAAASLYRASSKEIEEMLSLKLGRPVSGLDRRFIYKGGRDAYLSEMRQTRNLGRMHRQPAEKIIIAYLKDAHPELLLYNRLGAAIAAAVLRDPGKTSEDVRRAINKHFDASMKDGSMSQMVLRAGGEAALAAQLQTELKLTAQELIRGEARVEELWPYISDESAAKLREGVAWRKISGASELVAAVYERTKSPQTIAHALRLFFDCEITRAPFKALFQGAPGRNPPDVPAELRRLRAGVSPEALERAEERTDLVICATREMSATRRYSPEARKAAPATMSERLRDADFESILSSVLNEDTETDVPNIQIGYTKATNGDIVSARIEILPPRPGEEHYEARLAKNRGILLSEVSDIKGEIPSVLSGILYAADPPILSLQIGTLDQAGFTLIEEITLKRKGKAPGPLREGRLDESSDLSLAPYWARNARAALISARMIENNASPATLKRMLDANYPSHGIEEDLIQNALGSGRARRSTAQKLDIIGNWENLRDDEKEFVKGRAEEFMRS